MKFKEVAALYGAKKLRDAGIAFDEIQRVDFDVSVREGCPTCGPETEYEGRIIYRRDNKHCYHTWEFTGLDDILTQLFDFADGVEK